MAKPDVVRGHIPRNPLATPHADGALRTNSQGRGPPGGSAGAIRRAPTRPSAAVRLNGSTSAGSHENDRLRDGSGPRRVAAGFPRSRCRITGARNQRNARSATDPLWSGRRAESARPRIAETTIARRCQQERGWGARVGDCRKAPHMNPGLARLSPCGTYAWPSHALCCWRVRRQ